MADVIGWNEWKTCFWSSRHCYIMLKDGCYWLFSVGFWTFEERMFGSCKENVSSFFNSFSHRFAKKKKLSFDHFSILSIRIPFFTDIEIKSRKSEQKLFWKSNKNQKKLLEYGKPFLAFKKPKQLENTSILPPVAPVDMTKLNNELIFDSFFFIYFFLHSTVLLFTSTRQMLCLE